MKKLVLTLAIVVMILLPVMRVEAADKEKELHCLYNPVNKEYLYTIDEYEKKSLENSWEYKGVVCTLPMVSDTPVYRMLDPVLGTHLYTSDYAERIRLVQEQGWKLEGPAFYVDDNQTTPVYRLFNPLTGEHQFSAKSDEITSLENAGWIKEGVAFYGLKAGAKDEVVLEKNLALAESMVGSYANGMVEILKENGEYVLYDWGIIATMFGKFKAKLYTTIDDNLVFSYGEGSNYYIVIGLITESEHKSEIGLYRYRLYDGLPAKVNNGKLEAAMQGAIDKMN